MIDQVKKIACLRLRCGVLTMRRPRYDPVFIRGAVEIAKVVEKYNLVLEEGVPAYYEWERNQKNGLVDFTTPTTQVEYLRC